MSNTNRFEQTGVVVMNIYEVSPRNPIFHSQYYVVASSFDDAERQVIEAESKSGDACAGIDTISRIDVYDPEYSRFIGFEGQPKGASHG